MGRTWHVWIKRLIFYHYSGDTWSLLWLQDHLENLGYTPGTNLASYWTISGKGLGDGLRSLTCDENSIALVIEDLKTKLVSLFVDHVDIIRCQVDDVW